MNSKLSYPQNPEEWQEAIFQGIGLSKADGTAKLKSNDFPYSDLEDWIRTVFAEGFHPDFIPALTRNIRGLVNWVYGEGEEPNWKESD